MNSHKVYVHILGCAVGITWGLGLLLLGILGMLFGYGIDMITVLSSIYVGYAPTIGGTLLGVVWALIDGYIAGALFAWIYNMLVARYATH